MKISSYIYIYYSMYIYIYTHIYIYTYIYIYISIYTSHYDMFELLHLRGLDPRGFGLAAQPQRATRHAAAGHLRARRNGFQMGEKNQKPAIWEGLLDFFYIYIYMIYIFYIQHIYIYIYKYKPLNLTKWDAHRSMASMFRAL